MHRNRGWFPDLPVQRDFARYRELLMLFPPRTQRFRDAEIDQRLLNRNGTFIR